VDTNLSGVGSVPEGEGKADEQMLAEGGKVDVVRFAVATIRFLLVFFGCGSSGLTELPLRVVDGWEVAGAEFS
jgi:hypothetical protein